MLLSLDKAEYVADGLVSTRNPQLVIIVIVLENFHHGELLSEAVDNVHASLFNIVPVGKALNVNKAVFKVFGHQIVS